MLDFRFPQVEDKLWVDRLLSCSQFQGCEYSFGNIFIWSNAYNTKITRFNDFFISKSGHKDFGYCFPAGSGDLKAALNAMKEDAFECGHPFRLFALTPQSADELEKIMPGQFDFTPYDDGFDYIYLTEDLINLPGRKFHGKRNHIAYFEKTYNWTYESITIDNILDCMKMNESWEKENREKHPHQIDEELTAIKLAFSNFSELNLVGGLIRVDGNVIAYTVGEKLNDNTFCTHIEKAIADIRGSFPIINREFAKNALSGYEFVNREEDMGIPGLRKAKLSYNPAYLLEKYVATYKVNL